MSTLELLATRERGQIPVSIGTSLALEGAAGILEEAPVNPAPIITHAPRQCWVHLKTLFRNLYGAFEKFEKSQLMPDDYLTALEEEVGIIDTAVSKMSQRMTSAVFYSSTYKSLEKKFPHAKIKRPKTPLQIEYDHLETVVVNELIKRMGAKSIPQFDVDIKGSYPKSFILTHAPVDLLSQYRFDDLKLLESHTGRIKSRSQWNTKLTGGDEKTALPFNRFTLQLFGDNSQHFYAMSALVRRVILDIAKTNRWTSMTTKEKILNDVKKSHDPLLLQMVRDWFK